jgi:hypothetical protein
MPKFAIGTDVSVARSRAEIEEIVSRYGADQFGTAFDEASGQAMIQFRLQKLIVRFVLPLPKRSAEEFRYSKVNASDARRNRRPDQVAAAWEQACRQRWRALALAIKAKLEAVECEITTFEEEFLAHIVMPGSGRTVGQYLLPELEQLTAKNGTPTLLEFKK